MGAQLPSQVQITPGTVESRATLDLQERGCVEEALTRDLTECVEYAWTRECVEYARTLWERHGVPLGVDVLAPSSSGNVCELTERDMLPSGGSGMCELTSHHALTATAGGSDAASGTL